MITTSSIFLKSLADVGITHVFANWGSDHPALLEELQRQRSINGQTQLEIVTSPNEMVALSAAQGYAQACGRVAAVIVHVDVGTQGLAGAVHNVDRGRVPVLIYAGSSPYSLRGEHQGSRNEWIHWMQDIPDQPSILRQYMRFTGEIQSGQTTGQTVVRAFQFATSAPQGPAYIWARRETSEAEVPESLLSAPPPKAVSVQSSALPSSSVSVISKALVDAKNPLIITSHLGRNPSAVDTLVKLCDTILPIRVFSACPSTTNIPFNNRCFAGLAYLQPGTHTEHLERADVILLIDVELPWIEMLSGPSKDARIFLLDEGDPLKRGMGSYAVDAELVCSVSAEEALNQITVEVQSFSEQHQLAGCASYQERWKQFEEEHERMISRLDEEAAKAGSMSQVVSLVRQLVDGKEHLILNEGISNYPMVWNQMRADKPGRVITSGGSSLGWSLGAAVGASLSLRSVSPPHDKVIVSIVGDGSFLFCVPSSAYWMARRYETPFLTIVLNNGGWRSPKLSMLAVHQAGYGSRGVSGDTLSVGFGPDAPDYAGIAVAASSGWAYGRRVFASDTEEVEKVVQEAMRIVTEEKRCAVIDVVFERI